jgi:hypothetical protein
VHSGDDERKNIRLKTIFRRARSRESQFEHEAAFQHHRVFEHSSDARHEAIENEELSSTIECLAVARHLGAQALLKRLLERDRRCVGPHVALRCAKTPT